MKGLSKLIFLVVTISVLVLLLVVTDYSLFKLQPINIQKIDKSAKEWLFTDLRSKIGLETQAMVGKYVWEVSLDELMKLVEKDSRVEKVQVKRRFPNRIEVKLQTHRPLAVLINNKRQSLPIARDGTIMPQLKKEEFLDAPLLRGDSFIKQKELREKAMKLLLSLPKEGGISLKKISEVLYNKKSGFSFILSPDGEVVKMGVKNFEGRVNMADKVLAYLNSEGLKSRVIDVRFSKKVVVRLRNAP